MVKSIDTITTKDAYHAAATSSTASEVIHVSGQVGTTKSGKVPACYVSQIHLALLNLRKIIITAGASISDIAKLTLYIVNYDPKRRLHTKIIQKFLRGHRPAITLVPVSQLAAAEWLFEVEAVICKPAKPQQSISLAPTAAPKQTVDVIVVGAGLSGLVSARDVTQAGLSCLVLEARDRVGGKTWSTRLPDGVGTVDLGAAWINDTNQRRAYALAKQFGVELIEQNTTGNCVIQDFDGQTSTFSYGELPPFSDDVKEHLAFIRDMAEADCQKINSHNPRDEDLDSITFETYLRRNGASDTAIATATVWTRAMLGQEPSEVSALYFLTYCKAGGGLLQMRSDRKGGGQHLRVRQGTQAFSNGLASLLPDGTLQLSTVVQGIHQNPDGVVDVQTLNGAYRCKRVIISLPSPVYKTIRFEPPLPAAKILLHDSANYGYYTKVMMVFKKPFWVERGFCGLVQSFTGPASVIRDTSSPPDDKWVLTCFLAGELGVAWSALSEMERREQLLKQIVKLYGAPEARDLFVTAVGHEWSTEAFSGWGCPCTAFAPGVLDTVGHQLTEPFGNLHFIGTETAGEWKGYMEGAIITGERGASEVIKKISDTSSRL